MENPNPIVYDDREEDLDSEDEFWTGSSSNLFPSSNNDDFSAASAAASTVVPSSELFYESSFPSTTLITGGDSFPLKRRSLNFSKPEHFYFPLLCRPSAFGGKAAATISSKRSVVGGYQPRRNEIQQNDQIEEEGRGIKEGESCQGSDLSSTPLAAGAGRNERMAPACLLQACNIYGTGGTRADRFAYISRAAARSAATGGRGSTVRRLKDVREQQEQMLEVLELERRAAVASEYEDYLSYKEEQLWLSQVANRIVHEVNANFKTNEGKTKQKRERSFLVKKRNNEDGKRNQQHSPGTKRIVQTQEGREMKTPVAIMKDTRGPVAHILPAEEVATTEGTEETTIAAACATSALSPPQAALHYTAEDMAERNKTRRRNGKWTTAPKATTTTTYTITDNTTDYLSSLSSSRLPLPPPPLHVVHACWRWLRRKTGRSAILATRDPITPSELYSYIRHIQDPEHPYSIEQLDVVSPSRLTISISEGCIGNNTTTTATSAITASTCTPSSPNTTTTSSLLPSSFSSLLYSGPVSSSFSSSSSCARTTPTGVTAPSLFSSFFASEAPFAGNAASVADAGIAAASVLASSASSFHSSLSTGNTLAGSFPLSQETHYYGQATSCTTTTPTVPHERRLFETEKEHDEEEGELILLNSLLVSPQVNEDHVTAAAASEKKTAFRNFVNWSEKNPERIYSSFLISESSSSCSSQSSTEEQEEEEEEEEVEDNDEEKNEISEYANSYNGDQVYFLSKKNSAIGENHKFQRHHRRFRRIQNSSNISISSRRSSRSNTGRTSRSSSRSSRCSSTGSRDSTSSISHKVSESSCCKRFLEGDPDHSSRNSSSSSNSRIYSNSRKNSSSSNSNFCDHDNGGNSVRTGSTTASCSSKSRSLEKERDGSSSSSSFITSRSNSAMLSEYSLSDHDCFEGCFTSSGQKYKTMRRSVVTPHTTTTSSVVVAEADKKRESEALAAAQQLLEQEADLLHAFRAAYSNGKKRGNIVVDVEFKPTIPHCSQATLIGLLIRMKLLRSMPPWVKAQLRVQRQTHVSWSAITKQLNDKERVSAAAENPALLKLINRGLMDTDAWMNVGDVLLQAI